VLRAAPEMQAVLKADPFPDAETKLTCAIFLDRSVPRDALEHVTGRGDKKLILGDREIFVS
jgi:hypothetical protein